MNRLRAPFNEASDSWMLYLSQIGANKIKETQR